MKLKVDTTLLEETPDCGPAKGQLSKGDYSRVWAPLKDAYLGDSHAVQAGSYGGTEAY